MPVETSGSYAQAKALDAVLKEVNSRFGKGSIMKLGSTPVKV